MSVSFLDRRGNDVRMDSLDGGEEEVNLLCFELVILI